MRVISTALASDVSPLREFGKPMIHILLCFDSTQSCITGLAVCSFLAPVLLVSSVQQVAVSMDGICGVSLLVYRVLRACVGLSHSSVQPPGTGRNVSLCNEISLGVETHLEKRIKPRETDIFTAFDLGKPVGADMALDLEPSQGVKHTFRQEEADVLPARP